MLKRNQTREFDEVQSYNLEISFSRKTYLLSFMWRVNPFKISKVQLIIGFVFGILHSIKMILKYIRNKYMKKSEFD